MKQTRRIGPRDVARVKQSGQAVKQIRSCNKYGKLDVIYQKELLSSLYPTWRDWITSVRATKKDFNSLFKLLAGIAPECALPSRSKASICSEVTVGPPWMNKLLEKGCPDETSTANLPQEFWKAYGWWYISEGPNNSGFSCLGHGRVIFMSAECGREHMSK